MKHRLSACTALCAVVALMASCRTAEVVVERPVPVHDTIIQTQTLRDSVYIDQWHEVVRQGDTVYDTKIINRYQEKVTHDTIKEVQELPVEVVRTETVERERELTALERLLMWVGGIVVSGGIVYIAIKLWQRR